MTPSPSRQQLLEACIERTAEHLGDIHPPVIAALYRRHPEARELFERHGLGMTASLERSMVDSALYCVMTWFLRPAEVRDVLSSNVVLHEALDIPAGLMAGLLEALLEVLQPAWPGGDAQARATRDALAQGLREALAAPP